MPQFDVLVVVNGTNWRTLKINPGASIRILYVYNTNTVCDAQLTYLNDNESLNYEEIRRQAVQAHV
jgi:hypothetical protein